MVISAAEVLVRYVRFIPAENELLVALLSSFLYELPVCVCACLRVRVLASAYLDDEMNVGVKAIAERLD